MSNCTHSDKKVMGKFHEIGDLHCTEDAVLHRKEKPYCNECLKNVVVHVFSKSHTVLTIPA